MLQDVYRSLSPPRSGLFMEVSFRRLLDSCYDIMGGDTKHRTDVKDWRTSSVFHHYVDTLHEQLGDLENNTTRRVDARVLSAYKQLVDAISSQLQTPNVPSYVLPLPKDKRAISSIPLAVPKQNVDKSPTRHLRGEYVALPQKQHSIQAAGQAGHAQISAAYPSRQSGEEIRRQDLSAQATESILRHQNLQESLTDQLVPMAAALKRNAQAMEQAVSERGTLLDESETVLDGNVAAAGRAVRESKVVYATNKRGFCWTLTVLFFTGLTFIGVYLFIKATRLAGYKRFVPVRTTGLHEEL